MTDKCEHYYAEAYTKGNMSQRVFACIYCKELRQLSRKDKEWFFMENETTQAWAAIFKGRLAER